MLESNIARVVFVSSLIQGSGDTEPKGTLLLKDRESAARVRDRLASMLNLLGDSQVLVLDLAGVAFTPSSLQELVLPLAQRIRGGEHGAVRLVISTADLGVGDFIRYMSQAHQLSLYVAPSPFYLGEAIPAGDLTNTERDTLDTIVGLGGQVTASTLASTEGLNPSAASNRLANLDRKGYLVRRPRGRRKGDVYVEPRSSTSAPMVFE